MEKKRINKDDGGRYLMKGSHLWGILLFLALILIDQTTKLVADAYFSSADAPQAITIVPGWIYLRISYNDGIAYGIGDSAEPWIKILVIALTGIMMLALAILYFLVDKRRSWVRTSLVFIVSGGIGNLIDRLYYRVWLPTDFGVRDMVDLDRFGFAVCNFADFFIVAGAIMLVLSFLFFDKDAVFPTGKKYKALAEEAKKEEGTKKEGENG